MQIKEIANGKWASILVALGIPETFLTGKHGPCPMCGGKDRFRFDDKDGRGTYYCSGCGAGDGIALVRNFHSLDFKEAAKRIQAVSGTVETRFTKRVSGEVLRARLNRFWAESSLVKLGDPVSKYITKRVGQFNAYPSIRFHPNAWYDADHSYPAMVCLVTSKDGKPITIHRTFLTPDGDKAQVTSPKKLMSAPDSILGGSVRLGEHGSMLGIAEGIETALCASRRFGVPVWSAISATGLEAWEPPETVETVMIFGDNDLSFTGQLSSYVLARRLALRGLKVEVHIPDRVGSDWADYDTR